MKEPRTYGGKNQPTVKVPQAPNVNMTQRDHMRSVDRPEMPLTQKTVVHKGTI